MNLLRIKNLYVNWNNVLAIRKESDTKLSIHGSGGGEPLKRHQNTRRPRQH